MNYKIEVRDTPPIRVAYMRYQGIATVANKVFPKVFQSAGGKQTVRRFSIICL